MIYVAGTHALNSTLQLWAIDGRTMLTGNPHPNPTSSYLILTASHPIITSYCHSLASWHCRCGRGGPAADLRGRFSAGGGLEAKLCGRLAG